MNKIEQFHSEREQLNAILEQLNTSISTTQKDLSESFLGKANTETLSRTLAELQVKHTGLVNAIANLDQNILDEDERLIEADKQAEVDERKGYVKNALESLERASKLREQLAVELQSVVDNNFKARVHQKEIEYSVRGLVGRLAEQFKLHGALQMSATIPVPTIDDYSRLSSHVYKRG